MGRAAKKLKPVEAPAELLKLDLGRARTSAKASTASMSRQFVGVDTVCDLTVTPWPWPDNSVAEAHASHFLEHLTAWQRVTFCNEL